MILIDGKKIAETISANTKDEISKLDFVPLFCDVLVGDDPASIQYVNMKKKIAESVGIKFHNANFPASITTEELVKEIQDLNKIKNMCGIIVQLPLPQHLDKQTVLNAIDPVLDVDCLGMIASDKFYQGKNEVGFPTALACMEILDSLNLDLKNKNIVVLGQGLLVGRPVTALLKSRELTPKIITRQTPAHNATHSVAGGENKEKIIKEADIIISGIGHGKHIIGDMVKNGVVLIDAGTSESNGAIVGDVDLESVRDVASYVSPVPGGVGPVTVAMLLQNVLKVAKNIK